MKQIKKFDCNRSWTRIAPLGLVLATLPATGSGDTGHEQQAQMEQLLNMDFKELVEVRLTSVARRDQKLLETTAAVTVLDQEEIRRSGLTTVPELLRLVPGLNVARINASNWAISARGFNAQYSNKLLVLMDGRTLYTPLYAGVDWNLQDVLLADVERIEVIRGPGATMWGANAVNGVINIITKKAADTHGNLVTLSGGTLERVQTGLRHGGRNGEKLDYRIYAKGFNHGDFQRTDNTKADDHWDGGRGGFRLDWHQSPSNEITLQGELFTVNERLNPTSNDKQGGHLLTRWSKTLPDERNWSLQFYFDRNLAEGFDAINIYDLDWQYAFRHQDHALLWGAGFRLTTMDMKKHPLMDWNPKTRDDQTFNLFVQDEITLNPAWKLTLGTKLEHNDYTGIEFQPNARLLWRVSETRSLWAAVARAVRSPSRAESDIQISAPLSPTTRYTLNGNPQTTSETLLAYELGYRAQIKPELSLEMAAFYNHYDHVASTENLPPVFSPPTLVVRQGFDNKAVANSYGLETAMDWQTTDAWKLRASHTWLKLNLDPTGDSTDTTVAASAGNIPRHQWQLRSYLDLPHNLEFDAALYHVNRLTSLSIPAVTRLDLRLGWRPTPALNLSLSAQNLLDDRHPEFTGTSLTASEIPRAFLARMDWRF
ncbi:MAG: TonB-dependent receptor [Magnetococcales bacterium]|nr:TonB-dependent receptor [Magnetococcales bacterium]